MHWEIAPDVVFGPYEPVPSRCFQQRRVVVAGIGPGLPSDDAGNNRPDEVGCIRPNPMAQHAFLEDHLTLAASAATTGETATKATTAAAQQDKEFMDNPGQD
jgi:hypothetical protein